MDGLSGLSGLLLKPLHHILSIFLCSRLEVVSENKG